MTGDNKIDFRREYPEVNEQISFLLNKLFTFNPYLRKDASSLLKLSIFDSCRNKEMEKPAPFQI